SMRPARDIHIAMSGAAARSRRWSTSIGLMTAHSGSSPESCIAPIFLTRSKTCPRLQACGRSLEDFRSSPGTTMTRSRGLPSFTTPCTRLCRIAEALHHEAPECYPIGADRERVPAREPQRANLARAAAVVLTGQEGSVSGGSFGWRAGRCGIEVVHETEFIGRT